MTLNTTHSLNSDLQSIASPATGLIQTRCRDHNELSTQTQQPPLNNASSYGPADKPETRNPNLDR